MTPIDPTKELRFGIVGCGQVVQDLHLPAWSVTPGVQLAAICDGSQTALDAVSRRAPDAHAFNRFDDFLEHSGDLAFVVLATPGITHPDLAPRILAKGINLLCEKPLALTAPEARRLYALAEANGAALTCIHNYRFKENAEQALRVLRKGQLGDLVAVNLKFRSGALFGNQVQWRNHERENRMLLFDYGIHPVDIAMLFLGPLKALQFVDADVDSAGIQRVVFATLHQNGARGAFDLMVDASSTSTEIEVLGEAAGLSIQFFPQGFRMLPGRDNPVHRLVGEGRRLYDFARETLVEKLTRPKCPHRASSHAHLFNAFVESLRGRQANPVPAVEVLETVQLLDEVASKAYAAPTKSSAEPVPDNSNGEKPLWTRKQDGLGE